MNFITYMLLLHTLSRYLHLYYNSNKYSKYFLETKIKLFPYLPTHTWLIGSGLGKQTIFYFWPKRKHFLWHLRPSCFCDGFLNWKKNINFGEGHAMNIVTKFQNCKSLQTMTITMRYWERPECSILNNCITVIEMKVSYCFII